MLKELLERFTNNGNITTILNKAGTLQSLYPPETLFGFTYHAYCIPPFKPEHTLILGYGTGMIADLMNKVWGDCKITGVDIIQLNKTREFDMVIQDAYNFVRECADNKIKKRFDYVVLDLFDCNVNKHPDFIFETSFAMRIKEICTKLLCTNIFTNDVKRMRAYYDYDLKFLRHVNIYGNSVIYWRV